jgi:hypothetical protein
MWQKRFCHYLSSNLLVLCERIGEVLKKEYSTYHFVKKLALAQIGVALDSV